MCQQLYFISFAAVQYAIKANRILCTGYRVYAGAFHPTRLDTAKGLDTAKVLLTVGRDRHPKNICSIRITVNGVFNFMKKSHCQWRR